MNKIERIAVFALAAFLIGYFCYQVAYGIEVTIGPNSSNGSVTIKVPPLNSTSNNESQFIGPNGTIITAPPGSIITPNPVQNGTKGS